jgi:hypothetical protein
MSEPITLNDIYELFRVTQEALRASQIEYDRRAEEADRRAAESKAEYDRRAAESRAEYERLFAESKAEHERLFAESRAEYDRRAEKADRRLAKLEKSVANTNRAVDALTTRWGRFVEELVEPAVVRLFQARGIDVVQVFSRARTRQQGQAMEIDIIAIDGQEMVAVECKSRLSYDDVNEFISKLERFKSAFPQYENFRLYGAVAGIEINQGVDRYAYQKGLFVIKPSGDTVEIINDANFRAIAY